MAGTAVNCLKWMEIAGNVCKWLECLKWLEMAGRAGNKWKWLEMAGMAGNSWK